MDKPRAVANEQAVLTSAAQILSLTPEEANAGQPVCLRGLVTLYRPDWKLFFVQDITGGVYLFEDRARRELHSGALAAKEMGGELRGESEGPGKGAAFTLELPLQKG